MFERYIQFSARISIVLSKAIVVFQSFRASATTVFQNDSQLIPTKFLVPSINVSFRLIRCSASSAVKTESLNNQLIMDQPSHTLFNQIYLFVLKAFFVCCLKIYKIKYAKIIILPVVGSVCVRTLRRAIAQAVSLRLPTAAARVQTRVWSCGIL
jgi:hypothetical protein